jgi:hypothetical protein
MNTKFRNILVSLPCVLLLLACQTADKDQQKNIVAALSSDNGQLDLSQSTFEQQKIEKAQAATFLAETQKKRVVIEVDILDESIVESDINIAVYARKTENKIGEKLYRRIRQPGKDVDPCFRFKASDDAQRYFLKKGGPKADFWELDPDGDGFACEWDPEQYRSLY